MSGKHFPLLRAGKPYRSLSAVSLKHFVTGQPVAEVSQANRGLVSLDLARLKARPNPLGEMPVRDLTELLARAAKIFMQDELPMGERGQSPGDYVRDLSATTGMPLTLCRSNMEKIEAVLKNVESILGGLTRGLDLEVLDRGFGFQDGRALSYVRQTESLGCILPSNSPGVHSLWIPAIALKTPLVLRPGRQEPWTPFRVAQALMAAGCPPEACSFYPSDYDGAAEILLRCGRSMLFGDESTVGPWRSDPRIQIHGPGWSKVLVGADQVDRQREWVDLMVSSICANGGRSCINASGVWTAGGGRELAEALARRLASIEARPLDHPEAGLAAFANRDTAERLSRAIDALLETGGAEDFTARFRGGGRVRQADGAFFLLPTLIWCDSPDHPLAQAEYLFPFATVVEVPQTDMLTRLGPTLVASVLTEDGEFVERLLDCRQIDRLNVGPVPTWRISWDQPHEGNLFEFLYRQRAFQAATTTGGPLRVGATG